MGFNDWGAKVKRDRKAVPQNVNTCVDDVIGGDVVLEYISHYKNNNGDGNLEEVTWPVHAVLGDRESGLIVCLYKSSPAFIFQLRENVLTRVDYWENDKNFNWYIIKNLTLEIDGVTVEIMIKENPGKTDDQKIVCRFKDIGGHIWEGVVGMGIGEGFEKWV